MNSRSARRAELDIAFAAVDQRRALNSAADLFSRHGFDGATMAEIAREAGLSLKALYNVFPSKEELFEAVIADRYDQRVLPVLHADRRSLTPAERIFAIVDGILLAMVEDRAFMQLYARGSAGVPAKLRAAGRDPYIPYVNALRDHLVAVIAECPTDLGPRGARDLAVALTGALFALATDAFSAEVPRPVEEVGATLRELFSHSFGRIVGGA